MSARNASLPTSYGKTSQKLLGAKENAKGPGMSYGEWIRTIAALLNIVFVTTFLVILGLLVTGSGKDMSLKVNTIVDSAATSMSTSFSPESMSMYSSDLHATTSAASLLSKEFVAFSLKVDPLFEEETALTTSAPASTAKKTKSASATKNTKSASAPATKPATTEQNAATKAQHLRVMLENVYQTVRNVRLASERAGPLVDTATRVMTAVGEDRIIEAVEWMISAMTSSNPKNVDNLMKSTADFVESAAQFNFSELSHVMHEVENINFNATFGTRFDRALNQVDHMRTMIKLVGSAED